jgi:hypothetical protein
MIDDLAGSQPTEGGADPLHRSDGTQGQVVTTGASHNIGCSEVTGDRYAGEWVQEAFRNAGITYLPSDYNKSEIYLDLLAAGKQWGSGATRQ